MKYYFNLLLLLLLLSCSSFFAQEIQVERMNISWKHDNGVVTFTVSAPDDGWVALGFNSKNDIVGSNLIMVGVEGTKVTTEDFYVVGAGNPKPMKSLGSQSQIINPSGTDKNGITSITFSIPVEAFDQYHKNLHKGEKLWLICAYSMEDEFDHHSRMRRHVEITL